MGKRRLLEEYRNARVIAFIASMSALAMALSIITIPFLFGLRIHLFQFAIFLAAATLGPLGGLVSGAIGGLYMAMLRGDPTIIIGNALLGLVSGFFARKVRPFIASMMAWFLVQAPWIYLTGTYLLHIPSIVIQTILILLTVEDTISAALADFLIHRITFFTKIREEVSNIMGRIR